LERLAHDSLRPGDRYRLDRGADVLPQLVPLGLLYELAESLGLRVAELVLNARVQVVVVLSHHPRVRVGEPRSNALVRPARPLAPLGCIRYLLAMRPIPATAPPPTHHVTSRPAGCFACKSLTAAGPLCDNRDMFGGRSIQLLRVFGIRIGVDPTWFIVLFLVT